MHVMHVKGQVETLTSEAVVVIFFAAVQYEVIKLTYDDNSNDNLNLKAVANALGFAGFLLDGIAAFLALLASSLWCRISEQELYAIQQLRMTWDFLDEFLLPRDIVCRVRATFALLDRNHAEADNVGMPACWKHNRIRNAASVGDAAGTAMLFGNLCFFASVVFLASSTRPPTVWIVSATMGTLVVLLPLILRLVWIRLPPCLSLAWENICTVIINKVLAPNNQKRSR
ncbi:hypothetical protein B0H13DRAFT_1943758 [Mycena leptocephala]|nr:hypothetical protein B0H13DRAFT_1943758 [Mycena leptocephala]